MNWESEINQKVKEYIISVNKETLPSTKQELTEKISPLCFVNISIDKLELLNFLIQKNFISITTEDKVIYNEKNLLLPLIVVKSNLSFFINAVMKYLKFTKRYYLPKTKQKFLNNLNQFCNIKYKVDPDKIIFNLIKEKFIINNQNKILYNCIEEDLYLNFKYLKVEIDSLEETCCKRKLPLETKSNKKRKL